MSALDQPTIPQPQNRDLPRRTIIKGAAWSVPVIAAAVSVPLSSASDTTPPPPIATQFFTGVGSGSTAGRWSSVDVHGEADLEDATLPDDTVITVSAPDGGEISIRDTPQTGILSITKNDNGSYTIIPQPGVTTVKFYVTRSTAGSIIITATTATFDGSATGNWV